jgi:hypothetical protein
MMICSDCILRADCSDNWGWTPSLKSENSFAEKKIKIVIEKLNTLKNLEQW